MQSGSNQTTNRLAGDDGPGLVALARLAAQVVTKA